MNEASCSSEGLKPKVSKLAMASALVPFVLCINSLCFMFLIRSRPSTLFLEMLLTSFSLVISLVLHVSGFLSPAFVIVGIWATIKIWKSKGAFKGYILSLSGIGLSILSFYLTLLGIGSIRPEGEIRVSEVCMKHIAQAIRAYSNDCNNRYPAADRWCDLLVSKNYLHDERILIIPNRERAKHYYAINSNAEPNSAGDVVLLFETKDGWNQFGGAELMSFDNHYRKGCNVLFNDGHVEFIAPKQKDKLRWGTETRENRESRVEKVNPYWKQGLNIRAEGELCEGHKRELLQ